MLTNRSTHAGWAGEEALALPPGGAKLAAAEGGAGLATPSSREDVPGEGERKAPRQRLCRLSITWPRPTPAQPIANPAPNPWLGGKRTRTPSRFPPACGEGGGGGKRALENCVLAYVAGVRLRRSRRPPVAAVAAAAVAVLLLCRPPPKGAGAGPSCRRRCRDAAGVYRPPELPGPGARCGALL